METTALAPCVAPQPEPQRCARTPGPRTKAAAAAPLDFLSRLTQDAQDTATPIGAFLAALPQVPKRHAKSSSERGRSFRERQQRHEDELEEDVEALKREILALDVARKARESLTLNRRTGLTGSLVQTIREYHRLFVHGLLELPAEPTRAGTKRGLVDPNVVYRIKLQEEFIRRMIDPNAIVGNTVGPEASIIQWRRYTQCHATMVASVTAVEVLVTPDVEGGSGEDVVTVVAQCALRVRFSRETFKMMFPHVLSNEAFLQRLIGKEITYDSVKRFQFSSDGRIVSESVDVDFIGGLMKAGCSLADISTLMGGAAITPDSMIVEVEDDFQYSALHQECIESPGVESVSPGEPFESEFESQDEYNVSNYHPTTLSPAREPLKPSRLSMAFLLSEEADISPSTVDESRSTNRTARHS